MVTIAWYCLNKEAVGSFFMYKLLYKGKRPDPGGIEVSS